MGVAAQTTSVSAELEAAAARVLALSTADQLQVFELLRERLSGEVGETKSDRKAQARAEALEAIRRVAAHLGDAGSMPSVDQFDEAAPSVAPGWNRGRVIRAWGKWRFAKVAFLGGSVRTTTEHRKLTSVVNSSKERSDDVYWWFVKEWLKSNPPATTRSAYVAWATKYNESLAPGDTPAPSPYRLYAKFGITWEDIPRVARGEIDVADARPTKVRKSERVCSGPYDLVSIAEIQAMLDTTRPTASARTRKPDFPRPVYSSHKIRLWIRSDVEAHLDGKPFPVREEDELGSEYLTVPEVAERLGVSPVSVQQYSVRHLPRATVTLGRYRLWHVSDVDAALERRSRRGRLDKPANAEAESAECSG